MAQIEIVQRFLDAGADLTHMTQRNAERLVKSLVDAGDVQSTQAQRMVSDLVDQGRKNRERLTALIDREVRAQIGRMGLASKTDLRRLERKVDSLQRSAGTKSAKKSAKPAKKSTKKKAAKTPAKKAARKKAASSR
jgi:polyhydroxyalkanoate synthesis regulator phasin